MERAKSMTESDIFTIGPGIGRNIAECNAACGNLQGGTRISSSGSCLPVDTECEQRVVRLFYLNPHLASCILSAVPGSLV